MRRRDRQMSEDDTQRVVEHASFGTISMIDEEGNAYGVPVSYAYHQGVLYIHGAKEGKKVRAFEKNPAVSMSIVDSHQVPGPITKEEYEQVIAEHGSVLPFLKNRFTTEFRSAIVTGQILTVTDEEERALALRVICQKYTPYNQDYIEEAVQVGLAYTGVYKLVIDTQIGKEKRIP